jgi:hypothetical protein
MYVLPVKEHVSHTNSSLAFNGENVLVHLHPELDPRELDKAFYLSGGRLNLIDWR